MSELKVKSIFGPTIQGEGSFSGTPAIFIRLSGCNKWNGKQKDKINSICNFCDTDFDNGIMTPISDIIKKVLELKGDTLTNLVVLTGGEPLIHPTFALTILINGLKEFGFIVTLETNGSIYNHAVTKLVDNISCSPKQSYELTRINKAHVNTWKFLFPYLNDVHFHSPSSPWFELVSSDADLVLQPMEILGDKIATIKILLETVKEVKRLGSRFKLGLQVHKIIGEE